ncbi:MAG: sigma-70 family RNA polymerase sigma factor [Cytophagales bacterium]
MDDNEILAAFAKIETQNKAFTELVKKYQQRVYWHIRKMVIEHDDADDITQDVFVKIWKNLAHFKNESSLYTWIYRIATNECLTFLTSKRKKLNTSFEDLEENLTNKLSTSAYISGDEIQIKLQKAILTLPEKQRLVFNMKYFDDLTYEEISEILETTVGGLKASYHIASKKIEEYMISN